MYTIDIDEQRAKTQEFRINTPIKVADNLCYYIPIEDLKDSSKTFVDGYAKDGNIGFSIIKTIINQIGFSEQNLRHIIEKQLYFCTWSFLTESIKRELVFNIINEYKNEHNINIDIINFKFNFIIINNKNNTNMPKFDVVIMNPPYCKNLHLKILDKCIEVSNKVISIQPCTWAAPHNYNAKKGKWRKVLSGKIDNFKFIPHYEANSYFNTGNSIEDLAIMVCVPNGGKFDIKNYGFKNETFHNLIKKVNIFNDDNILTMSSAKSRKNFGGTAEDFRKEIPKYYVPIYQWCGRTNCYDACVIQDKGKIQKGVSYFKFNSEIEKQNFLNSLKTTFMDWYYHTIIKAGDNKIQAYMFRFKDYSEPWTNKRFCDYFGITGYISDIKAEPNSEWEQILNDLKDNGTIDK